MTPKFISIDDFPYLHDMAITNFGGGSGVLDSRKLESAADAPINYQYYGQADIIGCAAAYAYHFTQAHAFKDGNKRIGHYACKAFLLANGVELTVSEDELYDMYIGIASGQLTRDDVENRLRQWVTMP